MIDWDDADDLGTDIAIASSSGGRLGCLLALVGAVMLVVVCIAAASNDDACSKMKCVAGAQPRLLDHACLCVSEARP